jgi:sRNA-binding carbon storage regulator CsrA
MLALSREPNQSVRMFVSGEYLGQVCLVEMSKFGGVNLKAKLGFDFPQNVKIVRDEVLSEDQKSAMARALACR